MRIRSQEALEAYLLRCVEEIATSPKDALPLVLAAPDHVEGCRTILGELFGDYLLRSHGLVGFALALSGFRSVASSSFKTCRSISATASSSECATVCWREALYRLYATDDPRCSLQSADEAVAIFEEAESLRDDCSLSAALATRGLIEGVGFQMGLDGFEAVTAYQYFERALDVAEPDYRMSRLSAVTGMGRILVSLWMGGGSVPVSPASVVEQMVKIRRDLRRRRTPFRSLIDSNARWLLALAMHRLLGGLGECAEKHLRDARKYLSKVGTDYDVLAITLDLQWCLLADGRFAGALKECEPLRAAGMPEALLQVWRSGIERRLITNRLAAKVFEKVRGNRGVVSPQAAIEIESGWGRVGDCSRATGRAYGF